MPKAPREAHHPRAAISLLALALALTASGCGTEQTSEATVDARPGIEQVGSADGPLIDEDEACERLHVAFDAARDRHNCSDIVVPDCPELIRPGGSLACLRFAEESVSECVHRLGTYESCADFGNDACVVLAVLDEKSEGCVPPGPPPDAGSDDDEGPFDSGAGEDDDVTAADDDVSDDDFADDDSADDDSADPSDGGPTEPADDDVSVSDSGVPSAVDSGVSEPPGSGPDASASDADSGASPLDAGTPRTDAAADAGP